MFGWKGEGGGSGVGMWFGDRKGPVMEGSLRRCGGAY